MKHWDQVRPGAKKRPSSGDPRAVRRKLKQALKTDKYKWGQPPERWK